MPFNLSQFVGPLAGRMQGVNMAQQQGAQNMARGLDLVKMLVDVQNQRQQMNMAQQQLKHQIGQDLWARQNMTPYQQAQMTQVPASQRYEMENVPAATAAQIKSNEGAPARTAAAEKDVYMFKYPYEQGMRAFESGLQNERDVQKFEMEKELQSLQQKFQMDMKAAEIEADRPYKEALTTQAYASAQNYLLNGQAKTADEALKMANLEQKNMEIEYMKEHGEKMPTSKAGGGDSGFTGKTITDADVKILFDKHFKGRGQLHDKYWIETNGLLEGASGATGMSKYDPALIQAVWSKLQNPQDAVYQKAVEKFGKNGPQYLSRYLQEVLYPYASQAQQNRAEGLGVE